MIRAEEAVEAGVLTHPSKGQQIVVGGPLLRLDQHPDVHR
jgi:hypothetical protein